MFCIPLLYEVNQLYDISTNNENDMKTGMKVSLIYVVLCFGYILVSNQLIHRFFYSSEENTAIQTYNGLVFVLLSGLLMLFLVKRSLYHVEHSNKDLQKAVSDSRLLFDKAPLPAFIVDGVSFKLLRINNEACLKYGYSVDSYRDKSFIDQVINLDVDDFRKMLGSVSESAYEELVFESLDALGGHVYQQAFCQRINYLGQNAIIMICLDVTAFKDTSVVVMDRMIDAIENERMTFSTEIHDGLKQYFGLANGMIRTFIAQASVSGKQQELLDRVENLTSVGIEECRRLSHAITPLVGSSDDLSGNLIHLVENLNYLDDIRFHLDLQMEHTYTEDISLNLYRIVQEATRNIRQHSEAKNAWISFEEKAGNLVMKISDDGKGFNANFVSKSGDSIGMTTMRTRAYKLNGCFSLRSELGKGTSLVISIPLDRDNIQVA